jgi:hypothetical protein
LLLSPPATEVAVPCSPHAWAAPHVLGVTLALAVLAARPARALDKQASAHEGSIAASTEGLQVSGAVMLGVSPYNPTYAARPDNTGLTLMRYAGHADVDLIGRRLSVPIDVNVFSDRQSGGARALRPSELDVIAGLTSTWAIGPGALEIGGRFEHDSAVDRAGLEQSYVDLRTRYLYSLASLWPGLHPALRGGDISGWATLGWFAYNSGYFARPENTGLALFRYALHGELSLWRDLLSVAVDTTCFTDRRAADALRPSELDLTPELILRRHSLELHVAYERDMPLDRAGLVQHFVYLLAVWTFSLHLHDQGAFEGRGQILSP